MKKTLLITSAIIASLAAYWYGSRITSEIALMDRFPDLDHHVVIEAHRAMLRDTFKGKYLYVEMTDEEALDRIFMTYVNAIIK